MTLSRADILKRISALTAYQASLWRINEQSEAADREDLRVVAALSKLQAALRETAA